MTLRRPACNHCAPLWNRAEIVAVVDEAGNRRRPPRRHGHRLWLVPGAAHWSFFYCPTRDELPAVVARYQPKRGAADFSGARLASTADLRLVVEVAS